VRLTPAPVAPDRGHEELAQLTLTWTLYDAGLRYADRKKLTAEADSQALDERLLDRSIATEVGMALTALDTARAAFRISGEAVAATSKNITEVEVLYKQGLARGIEVVDANARRYDAEVTRATAKLSMEQAYLDLRFALGLDPLDPEAQSARAR
jgi:outer membrane protein TolC